MMIRWAERGALLSCLLAGAAMAWGQTGSTPAKKNPPTFQVSARVVLTDVTVTDKDGNPVRGLKERDFQVFDNGRPEQLNSFEEHVTQHRAFAESAAEPAGVYTNAAMLHPPAVVNAILIDTTTIDVIDQMYLYEELTKFVKKLPEGEPVAIFCRSGQMTLLLQGFTSDHAALMKAIRKAIPHVQEPDAEYASDYETMRQMAYYLSQVPGRKNILWFTGGSRLFLQVAPTDTGQVGMTPIAQVSGSNVQDMANQPDWRQIYDVLEQERITLYPIDARGLVTYGSQGMIGQHQLMEQDAEATGGQARYNTNGLAQAAEHILATDGDYYTLTYSPNDLRNNGHWHRVEVKLRARGYRLSYRRGYFDDAKNGASPTAKTRTLLEAKSGKTKQVLDEQSVPIAFTAQFEEVSPLAEAVEVSAGKVQAPKGGQVPYVIVYRVPASAVTAKSVGADHRGTFVIGAGMLVFDHFGTLVKRQGQEVTMTADEREIQAKPDGDLRFDQEISLPRGENYLYLLVWDATTGRMGTLNLSLDVKKPGKP
jgi:VWFA-related protein